MSLLVMWLTFWVKKKTLWRYKRTNFLEPKEEKELI